MAKPEVQTATEAADRCVREWVLTSVVMGLAPNPLFDAVSVAAMEVNMITELARIYNFPTPRKLVVYKVLLSLAASIGPVYVSMQILRAATSLTLVGYAASVLTMGATNAISVYAVGKVFQKHFESGGTFLSSHNRVVTGFFRDRYAEGKKVVPEYVATAQAT